MESNNYNRSRKNDILTAGEISDFIFRCSYHTFMTEIKIMPDFPVPVGHPLRKGKLHWIASEVIAWRNENYRRAS